MQATTQPASSFPASNLSKLKRLPYRLDPNIPPLPESGLVRLPTVAKAIGQYDTAPFVLARQGRFPAPIKVSAKVTCWRAEQVHKWMEDPQAWIETNAGA